MKNSVFLELTFGVGSFIIFALYLRHVQPRIDHIFQRRKANLEEISSQFTENLVHLKGLDNLLRYMEETIDSTMYSNWIDIFIASEEKGKFVLVNKVSKRNRISEFDQTGEFFSMAKER